MTVLGTLLDDVRDRGHRFTVYWSGDETDLADRFPTHNVSIDYRKLPSGGPEPFLVIEENDSFAGTLGMTEVEKLLEPPIVRPDNLDGVIDGYRVFFEMLDDTMFTAMDRRQLLAVSREIEERAYRVGNGTLRVGFQTLSTFESQVETYRRLADTTTLNIHIYGVTDWTPAEISGITYHEYPSGALEQYWVLAFDGGTDETQACGLVAQDQPDGYVGFWTNDVETVDSIVAALTAD